MRTHVAMLAVAAVLVGCSQNAPTRKGPTDPVKPATTATSSAPADVVWTPAHDAGQPVRLEIPSLHVAAPVVSLGTAEDGSQDVPDSLSTVGWWRDGSRPGQNGNAVFVGHTATNSQAVFNDLDGLAPGDHIVVQADERVTFSVTRSYQITNADFADAAPRIYRTAGSPGVVLMTCSNWNGSEYETTTVVHARVA